MKTVSTPATGANTIPLPTHRQFSADLVTTTQPKSLDLPSEPQQSSSSAVDAMHDVSLIDSLVEAYAADSYLLMRARLQL